MAVNITSALQMKFTELVESKLYLPFDSDADDASGNGLTPSTESGGIVYPSHITPQIGSGAVQLAEATTNLFRNPILGTMKIRSASLTPIS